MFFSIWWQGNLPWLDLQLKPCRPVLSTDPPQELQVWGKPMGAPTPRPIAILMVSLGKQRPSEEIGGGFNHAPDSNEPAHTSQNLEISSVQWSSTVSNMCWTTGWSQDFCRFVAEGVGVSSGSASFPELGPCQGMGLMIGGQGGVAALGLRPHQPMPKWQMVQGWKHFRTQGHLISQGGLPGAMSLLGQN